VVQHVKTSLAMSYLPRRTIAGAWLSQRELLAICIDLL